MRYITIAFLKYTNDQTSYINYITYAISGQFTHCEIVFEDNKSCGIYQNENVFLRRKKYHRDEWVFKKIRVSQNQYKRILNLAKTIVKNGATFNYIGFLRALTAFPRPTTEDRFFCSELVIYLLQSVGLFTNIESSMYTPSMLFDFIKKTSFSDVSPQFRQRMEKKKMYLFNREI